MERTELSLGLKRNTLRLTSIPELPRSSIVLCSDIEGPWFIGDFVDVAMSEKCKPKNGAIEAIPTYGHLIYQEIWRYFTETTKLYRRNSESQKPRDPNLISLSQEGTDTIFTLPLLLASGATYDYLEKLTLVSQCTPGSKEMVKALQDQGVIIFGITTAPQEPYRTLVNQTDFLDPKQVIGSPFPLEETRELLNSNDWWGNQEISIVTGYLNDCYQIIDENSRLTLKDGTLIRDLSEKGRQVLTSRCARFLNTELGISYDPFVRRSRKLARTILGQVIEEVGVVGDRAKAALALSAYMCHGSKDGCLVTMGDGPNDAEMLRKAHMSIGINGADAAKAAKIAVVTDNVQNTLPIFEQIIAGERNPDVIVQRANEKVGTAAIICRGGPDISEEVLREHRLMKQKLRGDIIY